MPRLRKVLALPSSDWLLIVQAGAYFLALDLGLRVFNLRTLLTILERGKRTQSRGSTKRSASPEHVARCVELASRVSPYRPTCFKKALVLYGMLKRKNVRVEMVIGAAKSGQDLDAHAWVEYQEQVILGGPSTERYGPLCHIDGHSRLAKGLRGSPTTSCFHEKIRSERR